MTQQVCPPYLKSGDKVGIIAPSGKVLQEQLSFALDKIRSWDLKVKEGSHLYAQHGYFAGKDDQRLGNLQEMLDDPEISAIFCVRGGYGLTRIIDEVDLTKFLERPKWVIGYSDITALLLKLSIAGVQSVHGVMPVNFQKENAETSIESLRSFLFGETNSIMWSAHEQNITGQCKGRLIGGNLSILADSLGTSGSLNGENAILFMEEIDEYLYKIDRMLIQLKRAGIFKNIKGLLVGHFTSVKDTSTPFGRSLNDIILDKVADLNIPIAFGIPSGHEHPNLALPVNRVVSLEVNNKLTKIAWDD